MPQIPALTIEMSDGEVETVLTRGLLYSYRIAQIVANVESLFEDDESAMLVAIPVDMSAYIYLMNPVRLDRLKARVLSEMKPEIAGSFKRTVWRVFMMRIGMKESF
jgi:hypothetical protein